MGESLKYDAIVLAGGRSRRMVGRNKVSLPIGGKPLVASAVEAVSGAERICLVGPRAPLDEALGPDWDPRWVQTQEEPAFGGPVAGIVAGLNALRGGSAPLVAVLACDLPEAPGAIEHLLARIDELTEDALCALAPDGYTQWLLGLYRREFLEGRAQEIPGRDLSVRRFMAPARVSTVPVAARLLQDLDSPQDVAEYLAAGKD